VEGKELSLVFVLADDIPASQAGPLSWLFPLRGKGLIVARNQTGFA